MNKGGVILRVCSLDPNRLLVPSSFRQEVWFIISLVLVNKGYSTKRQMPEKCFISGRWGRTLKIMYLLVTPAFGISTVPCRHALALWLGDQFHEKGRLEFSVTPFPHWGVEWVHLNDGGQLHEVGWLCATPLTNDWSKRSGCNHKILWPVWVPFLKFLRIRCEILKVSCSERCLCLLQIHKPRTTPYKPSGNRGMNLLFAGW